MVDSETLAFASTDDLSARMRGGLNASLIGYAATLLTDASNMLRDLTPNVDMVSADTLKAIVCAMVKRALATSEEREGITNSSQSANGFSESFTYSNPTGDLYVTGMEKKRLGIGVQHVGHIDMWGGEQP